MPTGSKLHWYKYNLKEGIYDDLAGPFWEEITDMQNEYFLFEYAPDITQAKEQFKVVIEYPSEEYLCTLMERDETYVNRVAGQIEELFRHHPKNSLLFWILLFVREDYFKNSSHRLKAIERWIASGADSPYFYLEA